MLVLLYATMHNTQREENMEKPFCFSWCLNVTPKWLSLCLFVGLNSWGVVFLKALINLSLLERRTKRLSLPDDGGIIWKNIRTPSWIVLTFFSLCFPCQFPGLDGTQVFWVDLQGVGVQLENLPIERESENAPGLQLFLWILPPWAPSKNVWKVCFYFLPTFFRKER